MGIKRISLKFEHSLAIRPQKGPPALPEALWNAQAPCLPDTYINCHVMR